jgi:DNA-binding MarR family transcriptional regulator
MTDLVARVMEQWAQERPDLDPSPQGVIARLHRIALRLTEELVSVYAEHGLGEGEFDVLATLRRQGPPYALTPGELAAQTMVTTGAVTKRVDRCLARGWVTREARAEDGRGRLVALTDQGRELIDRAFADHLANEHRLLEHFSAVELKLLERHLTKWAEHLGL